jgi:hypothetical protein
VRILSFALALLAVPLGAALQEAGPRPDISTLAWLSGCWAGGSGDRQVEEHWMKPSGGTMLGMSRTVAGGRTVESEFIEIRQRDDALVYVARPSRQAEASFTWVSGSETSVRFENPAHDFPQAITYTLQPDGSLLARIEGVSQGSRRAVDFPMRRGGC